MPELVVNGETHAIDAPLGTSLAQVLREELGLTGTKVACNEGHCGACTVQVDGVPILSCLTLVHTVEGKELTTIEGLRDHPLVEAFVRADATQCGFCTPGQIVSAAALVAANPSPSSEEIRHGMRGTSAGAARIRKSRRRSRLGKADPHRERGRGPLRGEQWIVVDEDTLDQWPDGGLEVVGQPAQRIDGLQRARGEARYTADIQLPGMLHAAVLGARHARAREER